MLTRQLLVVAIAVILSGTNASAQEVRYYEKDGVTYRETRQVVKRSIPETTYREQSQAVYRAECTTQLKDTVQTYWTPVTEYRLEQRLVGRWNPFVVPYYEYRSVPTTRWERRAEIVKVPVVSQQLTPTTQIVRTPVTNWRTVEEEVISRVAIGTTSNASSLASMPSSTSTASGSVTLASPLVPVTPRTIPEIARREPIGGLSRLDNDPPRQGSNTAWRSADERARR